MAVIIEIKNRTSTKKLHQKVEELNTNANSAKKLDAKQFTGKVKSYGDGLNIRKN